MFEARITIKAEGQEQLQKALDVIAIDLNDTDLSVGGYKLEGKEGGSYSFVVEIGLGDG